MTNDNGWESVYYGENTSLDIARAKVLLRAAYDLLSKCDSSRPFLVNALEETVYYDGAECDGWCLANDIAYELGLPDLDQ